MRCFLKGKNHFIVAPKTDFNDIQRLTTIINEEDMKYLLAALISLYAVTSHAGEPNQSELEVKLSTLENRTAKFISGKEKMTAGFTNLAPNVRQIACKAYSADTDKDIIKSLKKDITYLEKKKNFSQLNEQQVARLNSQKETVQNLTPGIDCSKL